MAKKARRPGHYARNFERVTKNKRRRVARFEKMVAESQARHGGTSASRRSFLVREARRQAVA